VSGGARFDFGALRFEARREREACAERFDRLVEREAGHVGRDFEEHATGFAIVDGFEIGAIDHGADVKAERSISACAAMCAASSATRNAM